MFYGTDDISVVVNICNFNTTIMSSIKINEEDWQVAKIKLSRKYNHLTDDDLYYAPGEEEQLVERLAKRLKRTKDYVVFTISKQLEDLSSNRL